MTKKSLGEIVAGFENSSVFKAFRALNESPAQKALEDLHNSSAFKALERLRNSPAFKTMEASAKMSQQIAAVTGAGRMNLGNLNRLGNLMAASNVTQGLGAFSSGQLSAFAQANQWASCLANAPLNRLQSLYPRLTAVADLDTIQKAARMVSGAGGILTMRTAIGLAADFDARFDATRLKLSAFAGVSSMYGLDSSATVAAYQSVFGNWCTRPDLPPRFWRDPSVRHRMYEEAEVDPVLVSAEIDAALEVAVESGLTGGFRSEAGTVAMISVGAFSMSIRSSNTRVDAYHALGVFEEQLRAFIGRKLSEKAGPKWFKQRVSGDIGGKAKDTREAAVRQGEAPAQLIEYTDLGELCRIVLASNNWSEVFEPVFINGNEFQHDTQKLIAARRPTAHYRKLDGVRLLELICVIDRLIKRMENDGGWKDAIESDE